MKRGLFDDMPLRCTQILRVLSMALPVLVVGGLLIVVCPATAGAEVRGQGWIMTRLDLDVRLDPDAGALTGEGSATLRLSDSDASALMLTLGETGQFLSVETSSAGRLSMGTTGRLATLYFDEPQSFGSEVDVSFEFSDLGRAYQCVVDREGAVASWVSGWYPHSSDGSVRAPGTTRLTVPSEWSTLSNGRLTGRADLGNLRTDTWVSERSLARSFAAGPYHVESREVDGTRVAVYLCDAHPDKAGAYLDALMLCLDALEASYGSLPYEGYAIAEVPDSLVSWGGSSEQGFSMLRSKLLSGKQVNLPLIGHEMAHSWWGNYVGSRRPGSYMVSEGLAQYGATLALEAIEGPEAATEFLRLSRDGFPSMQCARGYFRLQRKGRDQPLTKAVGGSEGSGHVLANSKGHWVYHMLRRRVGDEVFFDTLMGLVDEYGDATMSLTNLRAAFEEAAPPEARVEAFFAQWLDREGAPHLELEWDDASEDSESRVRVAIVQSGRPYDLDLEIAVDTRNGTALRTVRVSEAEQSFVLDVPGKPVRVRPDPDHRLLMWRPEYGSWWFLYLPAGRVAVWELLCIIAAGVVVGGLHSRALKLGFFERDGWFGLPWGGLVGLLSGVSGYLLGCWGGSGCLRRVVPRATKRRAGLASEVGLTVRGHGSPRRQDIVSGDRSRAILLPTSYVADADGRWIAGRQCPRRAWA